MTAIRHVRRAGALAALAITLVAGPAAAQTIIEEWNSIKAPPAPTLKPVTFDAKTTALLLLDFNKQTCNPQRRPRCIASIPKVAKMLAAARAKGMVVAHSLGGGGKPEDIAKELAPRNGEPVVSSGVDKFAGTVLEKFLKDKGIKIVIVTGTAAHGAVIYTASAAAMRGMKVILPVDAMSSETPYAEQYTAWHLTHAPRIGTEVTLTRIADLKF